MRLVVTGGAGFVGKYVVSHLKKDGHEVTPIDITAHDVMKVDVTDRQKVRDALMRLQPDAVIHLAALAGSTGKGGGVESGKRPYDYFNVNLNGTLNIFEACRELKIDKVLCMSSFSPYGVARCPINEETPFQPNNPYGASKACVEQIAKSYSTMYNIKTVIFRPPLICGEGQSEFNALREFIFAALRDESIVILGEGTHVREFVHPQDVAKAYSLGVDYLSRMNEQFEVFVLGNKPVSMKDLAQMVIDKVGKGSIDFRSATKQVFNQFTDHSKATRILGWRPTISTGEIIARVITDSSNQFREKTGLIGS